ncbi:hypothetical protein [Marinicella sp. W31]|uniref:hypothetical protein n=1 Tax=Marinicella sp. W31 TaxID=3023713 RepID=UPI003758337E
MPGLIQENWVQLTIVGSVTLLVVPWVIIIIISRRRKRILQSGISKTAKILRFKPSMFKIGMHAGSEFMQGIDLWLEVDDGEAASYEVVTRSVIHISEFSKIHTDMLVTIKVDPENHLKVLIDKWCIG